MTNNFNMASYSNIDLSKMELPKIKIIPKNNKTHHDILIHTTETVQNIEVMESINTQKNQVNLPKIPKLGVIPNKSIINVHDETILTNKRILCKFYYIAFLYDNNNYLSEDNFTFLNDKKDIDSDRINTDLYDGCGYINIAKSSEEVLDLIFKDDSTNNDILSETLKSLQTDWHKQMLNISIDFSKAEKYYNPNVINKRFPDIQSHVQKNISSDQSFLIKDSYIEMDHLIVSVEISFHLTKEISSVDNYGINFKYLRQLISGKLTNYFHQFDECSMPCNLMPFCNREPDDIDDKLGNIFLVKPRLVLIPLT